MKVSMLILGNNKGVDNILSTFVFFYNKLLKAMKETNPYGLHRLTGMACHRLRAALDDRFGKEHSGAGDLNDLLYIIIVDCSSFARDMR